MWNWMIQISGETEGFQLSFECFIWFEHKNLFQQEKNIHILSNLDSFCFPLWISETFSAMWWHHLQPPPPINLTLWCIYAACDNYDGVLYPYYTVSLLHCLSWFYKYYIINSTVYLYARYLRVLLMKNFAHELNFVSLMMMEFLD